MYAFSNGIVFPPDRKEKLYYSVKAIFGNELPLDPTIVKGFWDATDVPIGRQRLNAVSERNILFWGSQSKCIEVDEYCKSCVTLTPNVPNSHHKDCAYYNELDKYPEYVEQDNPLGKCPNYQSNELTIDSCRMQAVSAIACMDCDFQYTGNVCEESLAKRFKKEQRANGNLKRKNAKKEK